MKVLWFWCLVDEKGKVVDLILFKSSGYTILDKAAISSVKKWLFEPGTIGRKKVKMWVKLSVRFKLNYPEFSRITLVPGGFVNTLKALTHSPLTSNSESDIQSLVRFQPTI